MNGHLSRVKIDVQKLGYSFLDNGEHGRPQEFSQGGASPKKAPFKTKKAPPKKNEIVISPFLGGSEACSPEKILTMVLPTTF